MKQLTLTALLIISISLTANAQSSGDGSLAEPLFDEIPSRSDSADTKFFTPKDGSSIGSGDGGGDGNGDGDDEDEDEDEDDYDLEDGIRAAAALDAKKKGDDEQLHPVEAVTSGDKDGDDDFGEDKSDSSKDGAEQGDGEDIGDGRGPDAAPVGKYHDIVHKVLAHVAESSGLFSSARQDLKDMSDDHQRDEKHYVQEMADAYHEVIAQMEAKMKSDAEKIKLHTKNYSTIMHYQELLLNDGKIFFKHCAEAEQTLLNDRRCNAAHLEHSHTIVDKLSNVEKHLATISHAMEKTRRHLNEEHDDSKTFEKQVTVQGLSE